MKALNDKLMLQDILAHLKDLITVSGTSIIESDCQKMRATVLNTQSKTLKNQYAVFEYMQKHNMYPIKTSSDIEIKQVLDTHCKG